MFLVISPDPSIWKVGGGGGGALESPGIPHAEKPEPLPCTVGALGVDIEQGSRMKTGVALHLDFEIYPWAWGQSHISDMVS